MATNNEKAGFKGFILGCVVCGIVMLCSFAPSQPINPFTPMWGTVAIWCIGVFVMFVYTMFIEW